MRKAWKFESDKGEYVTLVGDEFDGFLKEWSIDLTKYKEGSDIPSANCRLLADKIEEMNGYTIYERDGARWNHRIDMNVTRHKGVQDVGPIDFQSLVKLLRSARCCVRMSAGMV